MRLEEFGERKHGLADVALLLAVVCLALVTWSGLAIASAVPLWKRYTAVALTGLLALAALTRHPQWAARIRFMSGAWMVAAPHLAGFAGAGTVFWTYLLVGTLMMMLSLPGLAVEGNRLIRMAF